MTDLETLKAIEMDKGTYWILADDRNFKKLLLEQILKKLLEQYQFRAYGVRLK